MAEKVVEKTETKEKKETSSVTTKKATKKKTSERHKVEDIEKVVVDLGKKGLSTSQIGIELKKKHGVDKIKVLGTTITKILKKNKVDYDNDLAIVNKKISVIEQHYNKNRQDKRAKRELVKFIGLRKKLERYNASAL